MGKLTDRSARGKLAPGLHADEGGLYLNVTASGTRSWIFRATVAGRATPKGAPYRCEVGLGSLADVTLAEARREADRLRKLCRAGTNPLDEKRKERLTFEQTARRLFEQDSPKWAPEHAKRWWGSLEAHVLPKLGARPIESLERPEVVEVLAALWTATPETGRKVKQRVEAIFQWACDRGQYPGVNPLAGKIASLAKHKHTPEHMAAMPWQDVPAFMGDLERRDAIAALCLRFLVLTAARSGEARGARWSEIDGTTWTVPAERMKTRKPHHVPLSPAALAVLEQVRGLDSDLIFPAPTTAKGCGARPLSDMAFAALFRRMGVEGITTHGFRSSFRDWCGESARASREVAEAALSHSVGSSVERAYARSDLFARRAELMDAWSRYVTGEAGQVVQLVRA